MLQDQSFTPLHEEVENLGNNLTVTPKLGNIPVVIFSKDKVYYIRGSLISLILSKELQTADSAHSTGAKSIWYRNAITM